jgi:prophage regulatory protein
MPQKQEKFRWSEFLLILNDANFKKTFLHSCKEPPLQELRSFLFPTFRTVAPSQRQGENTMNNQTTRLIRLPEVLERTGFGKAWIYRLIKDDKFPAPVKIGTRAVAFVESEIDAWIQSVIETSRNNVA